jgi:hypothetical protein
MSPSAKKTKSFDCVEFKCQARARLHDATRDMSDDERREHIRHMIETGPLAGFGEKVVRQSKAAPKSGRL